MLRVCKDTIQGFVLAAVSFFSHILIMYVNIHSLILLDKSKYFIDNQFGYSSGVGGPLGQWREGEGGGG